MPGYGFSGKPTGPGWGADRIGGAWDYIEKKSDKFTLNIYKTTSYNMSYLALLAILIISGTLQAKNDDQSDGWTVFNSVLLFILLVWGIIKLMKFIFS
ncbi:hypothetical protein [Dyadobacter sp. MSC1_007]|jgi:hypothetical protein|uniref:hypothetical protein n=1 Tax=Dyadobacter sp. MSC1_007 TaxID=2909264 RepID=UPI00202DBB46|nr:hypothetical protein [Dyadobacter sp. MSC1_007]